MYFFQFRHIINHGDTNTKPGEHVDICMRNILDDDEVISNASLQDSYKRNQQKKGSVNNGIKKLPAPASLKALEIPKELRYFLLYDSVVTLGDHRFILLSTEEDLWKLSLCEIVFSDGTFKVPDFYQVSDDFFGAVKKGPIFLCLLLCHFKKCLKLTN